MAIVTETTYKHEATGIEAMPTTLDGKPVIAVNAGDLFGDISLDTARALVEVLQAALGDAPGADSDGWTPYKPGDWHPIAPGTFVERKFRTGTVAPALPANCINWGENGDLTTTAYRIVKESE